MTDQELPPDADAQVVREFIESRTANIFGEWTATEALKRLESILARLTAAEAANRIFHTIVDEFGVDEENIVITLRKQQAERDRYKEALATISALTDGQEGRTAQTMMMHGFSPLKALSESRDLARTALEPKEG